MTCAGWLRQVPAPAWRAAAALRGRGRYCVVALHRIADIAGDELSYPRAAFAELCQYWRDHFEVVPLDRLLARLAHGDGAASPTLTITFDDGYADNFEVAAPMLDRHGLHATFFVTSGVIGTTRRFAWDAWLASTPALMDWRQVRELRAAGFGIGAHTETHARLSATRGEALAAELGGARRTLEAELGEAVLDFAYPYGGREDCDATARTAIRQAGYRCCLACHGGLIAPGDSAFALNRISVSPRYHAHWRDWARAYARARWMLN